MTEIWGLGLEVWSLMLTAFMAVVAVVSIIIAVKQKKKRKQEVEPDTLVELIKETLKKVPTPLDPNRPPVIEEKVEEL